MQPHSLSVYTSLLAALTCLPGAAQDLASPPPGPGAAFGARIERQANQFSRSAQEAVTVAHAAGAGCVLVWQSRRQQEGTYGIYARRFNAAGDPIGEEVQVNASTRSMQMLPATALDAEGCLWVTWRSFGQDGDEGSILVRRFTPDLSEATPETLVNQVVLGNQTHPVLVTLPDSNALIAWQTAGEEKRTWIQARLIGVDGKPLADSFRVDAGDELGHGPPSLARGAGDEVFASYPRVDSTGVPLGVFLRRIVAGAPVGDELQLDEGAARGGIEPSLAANSKGDLLAGWLEADEADYGLRTRRLRRVDGQLELGPVRSLDSSTPGYLSGVSVALSESGAGLVAWNRHGDGPKRESGLFARRLCPEGIAQGEPRRVTGRDLGTQRIAVAHGATRLFLEDSGLMGFAWHGDAGDGDASGAHLTLLVPDGHELEVESALSSSAPVLAGEAFSALEEGARPHDPPTYDRRDRERRDNGPPTYGVDDFFVAFPNSGWTPPDPEMAVGRDRIVCMVNGGIAWFEKDGTLVHEQDINGAGGFWGSVGAGGFVFDPEVIWDPHSERFIAYACERNGGLGRFLFAVSDDSDPHGMWHKYAIDGGPLVNDTDIDSPNISVDGSVIYMGADYFGSDKYLVVMVDKASVLNGGSPSFTSTVINGRQSFGMPVNYDAGPPLQYLLWAQEFTTASTLRLYAITDPLGSPSVQFTTLTVPTYSHPEDPPQQGTSSRPELFEARFWSTVVRDGQLWATHHQGSTRAMARWYQFDLGGWPNGGTPTLVQSGDVDLGPDIWTFFPSIWVDADQNMAMTFARSAADEFISMWMVHRTAGDPPGTLQPAEIVREGKGPNTSGRWGDYSATNDDPAEPGVFWGHHEHRPLGSSWRTLVAKLSICAGSIENYCVTSPNSAGSGALMSATGSTSIADNNLTLVATGCPGNKFGLFYYGQGQVQNPLGDGFMCIGSNFVRLPVVLTDALGQASYALDFNNLPPSGQINPGETWDFQFWYRDGAGGPAGFNFSDALEITVCE